MDKIEVLKELIKSGMLQEAAKGILKNIPKSAIEKLTEAELAELLTALNKTYWQGSKSSKKEIEEYIGLPNDVSIWDIIGDKNHSSGYVFSDGLYIADILEKRADELHKYYKSI